MVVKWKGSSYSRGGLNRDKWGNTHRTRETWRTPNRGGIVHSTATDGNLIGVERNRHHNYGDDPRAAGSKDRKRFVTFVRKNRAGSRKRRRSHTRRRRR